MSDPLRQVREAVSRESIVEAILQAEAAEGEQWDSDTKARVEFVGAWIQSEVLRAIATISTKAAGAAPTPDGWQMVPKVPTEGALWAADSASSLVVMDGHPDRSGAQRRREYDKAYRAMLAASPPPPVRKATKEMVEAALHAVVPGGAEVWAWLPQEDGWTPHQTARNIVETALNAALSLPPATKGEGR